MGFGLQAAVTWRWCVNDMGVTAEVKHWSGGGLRFWFQTPHAASILRRRRLQPSKAQRREIHVPGKQIAVERHDVWRRVWVQP